MKYLSTMGPAAWLRLYHEVTVAAADDQHFEYFGCHPGTGLLRVLSYPAAAELARRNGARALLRGGRPWLAQPWGGHVGWSGHDRLDVLRPSREAGQAGPSG